jgi:hypothetical protein
LVAGAEETSSSRESEARGTHAARGVEFGALKAALALPPARAERLFQALDGKPLIVDGRPVVTTLATLPDRVLTQIELGAERHGDARAFLEELQAAVTAAAGVASSFATLLRIEAREDARHLPDGTRFVVMEDNNVRAVQIQIDRATDGLPEGSYCAEPLLISGYKMPAELEKVSAGDYTLHSGELIAAHKVQERTGFSFRDLAKTAAARQAPTFKAMAQAKAHTQRPGFRLSA